MRPPRAITAALAALGGLGTAPSALAADAAMPVPEPNLGLAVVKMLGGLALVLALLVGLYWALRRWAPGRAGGAGFGGLRLLARLPLGPRKYVGLLRVADRVLVLGVSDAAVNLLAQIDDPEQVAAITGGGKKAFDQALASAAEQEKGS